MVTRKPSQIVGSFQVDRKSTSNKLCRYSKLDRLINEDGIAYIETPDKFKIVETNNDRYFLVDKGYENRLDLISHEMYGTSMLWWAIANMNNIENPLDVKAGLVLRIPTVRSINDSGVLRANGY